MKISRSCKLQHINWAVLPGLVELLNKAGKVPRTTTFCVHRYPDKIDFDSVEDVCRDVREHGQPRYFEIWFSAEKGFSLSISRGRNIHDQEFLYLDVKGVPDSSLLDSVEEFLGLERDEPLKTPPQLPRTAFIAHRFDRNGTDAAEKLARFLELLDFSVVTGRAYLPGSIAAKVRKRIEEQGVLFVVMTAGTDDIWLAQESVIGAVQGKPIFVLKDNSAEFKPGILADHEYIPFVMPYIEGAFIPVLEGLRELGFLKF